MISWRRRNGFRTETRHENHGDIPAQDIQFPDEFQSVHAGHSQVRHDQRRPLTLHRLDGVHAIVCESDGEFGVSPKEMSKEQTIGRRIVNDKNLSSHDLLRSAGMKLWNRLS